MALRRAGADDVARMQVRAFAWNSTRHAVSRKEYRCCCTVRVKLSLEKNEMATCHNWAMLLEKNLVRLVSVSTFVSQVCQGATDKVDDAVAVRVQGSACVDEGTEEWL